MFADVEFKEAWDSLSWEKLEWGEVANKDQQKKSEWVQSGNVYNLIFHNMY